MMSAGSTSWPSRTGTASTPSAMRCSSCEDTAWCQARGPGRSGHLARTDSAPRRTARPRRCRSKTRHNGRVARCPYRPQGPRRRARHEDMTFRVTATDGAARAGVIQTAHGEVPTPAFMPVGTKASVKTLHPDEVRDLGASILLGNTYHLHFRPGDELIAQLGGLHAFMGWDGPILTDSGGFQVFSLRDTIVAADDDGVTFRSVYDGAKARLTPEGVADIQAKLGSDVAMCLDVVLPPSESRRAHEEAVRRTTAWAKR